MKGAKLYKAEIWHYSDDAHDLPWEHWDEPPWVTTEIPDCETAEIFYLWQGTWRTGDQLFGPRPDNLHVTGTIKTYDHQFARYLIRRYRAQDWTVIGDCLLLYYTTDDGTRWRYRFNGVYFGSGWRAQRLDSVEEVDTGESEASRLTWILARFHHGNSPVYLSNWGNRVTLETWNGSAWVSPPPMPSPP